MEHSFTNGSFKLLAELEANNDRDWYKAHKPDFEAQLLDPFAQVLEAISLQLEARTMQLIAPAIIIYWNTAKLGEAVEQRENEGLPISEDHLAHISPLGWAHILLTGEYRWNRDDK